MIRVFFLLCVLLSASVLSSCQDLIGNDKVPAKSQEFEVVDVDAEGAAEVIETEEVTVLDVRTPEEFEEGQIDGAVNYNVQADGFEEAIKGLDFSKPIVVHCAAGLPGGRSRFALDFLKAAGAGKVYHLDGGMMAWREAGKEVKKPEAE